MRRYEFPAHLIVTNDGDDDAAREDAAQFCRDVNKNPDGPHVYLANAPVTQEEVEE